MSGPFDSVRPSGPDSAQGERYDVQVRSVRRVYEGSPILSLEVHDVRLPNGVERKFELIHHSGASAVVPLHENGDVVLLRRLLAASGEDVSLDAGSGQVLRQLAYVAGEPALDQRRVLPGEDEDAAHVREGLWLKARAAAPGSGRARG